MRGSRFALRAAVAPVLDRCRRPSAPGETSAAGVQRDVRRWVCIPLLAVALCLIATPGCERADSGPANSSGVGGKPLAGLPNIVLITVESLRADHVRGYGYDRPTTPNIDALATVGVTFTDAHAVTSWTLPSHTSLFTGLYPGGHQVITHLQRLHDSCSTVAEVLRDRGYQTAAVVSGPFLRRTYNLHQGFELYEESPAAYANSEAHDDITNPRMEQAITRFLREQRDPRRPFFLFAYFWDPHYDYIPPPPFDRAFLPEDAQALDLTRYETSDTVNPNITPAQLAYVVSQYDGEIACTDATLGRLWELLRSLDSWDDTAIILTADHGEEFFERGEKGHQHNLHVESVRVLLVLKLPGPARVGSRDARLVSLIDVMPTIAELADARLTGPVQGRSLLGLPRTNDQPIFFELTTTWSIPSADGGTGPTNLSEHSTAVRRGRHKYIVRDLPARKLLYDVVADPSEQSPLDDSAGPMVDDLAVLLDRFGQDMRLIAAKVGAAESVSLTPQEEERLRALGYIR